MHAEKCPICEGKGKVPRIDGWNCHEDACHGCGGKGWVEVKDGPYYTIQPSIDAPSIQPWPYSTPWYGTGDFPHNEPYTTCVNPQA
jgi:hypothetical protein